MDQDQEKKIEEVMKDLKKAKESLFNLYGEETKTAEIEHIDSAMSKLRSLRESE